MKTNTYNDKIVIELSRKEVVHLMSRFNALNGHFNHLVHVYNEMLENEALEIRERRRLKTAAEPEKLLLDICNVLNLPEWDDLYRSLSEFLGIGFDFIPF